eukprot:TRINITY_DN679_c0_g1_i1.p1 TRINITY_DN679_c0_g1~~TRINITY_DN679_c0_g1_i1.p1  ORF type:complete len:503 (-),score=112.32 TRINITY_DN679_c0_g1_i1:45-1553(-)
MAVNFEQQTLPNILCCLCGIPMPSNPSNMCVNCIRGQVDITEGIPKQVSIYWCRNCGRYLQPPHHWLTAELESPQLLTFCVKRIKGLSKVRLVDAGFVWTEPHSRRLKVKLTVQREVFTSTILQQVFIVEFVVNNQMCEKCTKNEAKDTWNAVVQARQRTLHKRTFFYLEQLILKHNAHGTTVNIKDVPDGLDFFFGHRSHALKFVDFLQAVAPCRFKTSEHLVSHDEHSNTFNYKYTFLVEIAPICREDLLCLPLKTANSLGFATPLVLVWKVSSLLHLIDPVSLTTSEMNATQYFKEGFRALSSSALLVEYTILDVTPLGPTNRKWALAEVQLARSVDLGCNDTIFFAKTHLGHLLQPGDLAMGYDLASGNYNESDLAPMRNRQMPDVILVKKVFPKRNRNKRIWDVNRLAIEEGEGKRSETKLQKEFEEFKDELEEDKEYRSGVNLVKSQQQHTKQQQGGDSMMDEDEDEDPAFPGVSVDELIEDMVDMALDDEEEDVE